MISINSRSTLEQDPRGRGDVLKGTTILITDQNIQDLFVMGIPIFLSLSYMGVEQKFKGTVRL